MTPEDLQKTELRAREDLFSCTLVDKGTTAVDTTSASNPSSTYVASIKALIPISLDLQDSNYAKWHELFLAALGRYGLSSHVLGGKDATPSDTSPTSEWARDDYTVLTWIYGSISLELFGIIMAPGSSARQIWNAIDNLFRDNKKSRAITLDAEFHNTPQGDMTISDYCAKLKNLADALDDVGQPVTDETLVLTMLRGLHEQYAPLRSFLLFQVPFPSFLQVRSAFVLEEAQKKTDARNAAATALWASGNSILPNDGSERTPSSGGGRGNSSISPHGSRGGGSSRGRVRGGPGRGRGDPWMFNPWTGLPTRVNQQQQVPAPQQQWQQPPWRAPVPGLLGARPAPALPQAYTAYTPAPTYNTPPMPALPQHHFTNKQQLDPALLHALNNMHSPSNPEWYMDSGASAHMASDPGKLSSLTPSTSHNVTVGNGASLPITHIGSQTLSSLSKPLHRLSNT